ncbi:hypothetical protein EV127DRAFT_495663 [Xylaria flabelliformis]|nr:hypothetical protein EV127DRAFT_495663 [Xylaria flabelliformis]
MSSDEDTIPPAEETAGVLVRRMSNDDSYSSDENGYSDDNDSTSSEDVYCVKPQLRNNRRLDGYGADIEFRAIENEFQGGFLGLLLDQWPIIKEQLPYQSWIIEEISNFYVRLPYYSGTKLWQLSKTYFPFPELEALFLQYAGDTTNKYFPFLDFQDTLAPDDLSAWTFLHEHFGVGSSDTLRFYLDILSFINCDSTPEHKVLQLYQTIHEKVISSNDVANATRLVRSYFQDSCLIMVPGKGWQRTGDCRWDAPMNTYFVGIEAVYSHFWEDNETLKSALATFMRKIVGVEDFSSRDITNELQWRKLLITNAEAPTEIVDKNLVEDLMGEAYIRISRLKGLTKDDRAKIRDTFRTGQFIHAENRWLSAKECAWSSTTNEQGKVALNMYWPRKKTVFAFLGVSNEKAKRQSHDRHPGARPKKAIPPLNNNTGLVEDLDASRDSKYLKILKQVISAAQETRFLRKGNLDKSTMKVDINDVDESNDDDESNNDSESNDDDESNDIDEFNDDDDDDDNNTKPRDEFNDDDDDDNTKLRDDLGAGYKKMIGAAGELYVYELLSTNLELPSFARRDWKSNIKKYVTEHPKYANMVAWSGVETADLVYPDVKGALTDRLIKGGYLNKKLWTGRKPTYDIEVKTTPGGCGTPFFMSNSQYQRMQTTSNGPRGTFPHDRIYIIFRVYNLGKKSIGHTIYVDPESLRTKGALKFTPEKWTVVPGRH